MSEQGSSDRPAAWDLAELISAAGIRVIGSQPPHGKTITSLSHDSRTVQSGACFVARQGAVDGHRFIGQAISAGAVAVIVQQETPVSAGVVCVRVADTGEAMARLAAAFFGMRDAASSMSLVGITGTNGKTTVAWLLRSIFAAAGSPAAMIGTVEYDLIASRRKAALTTPDPLDLCDSLSQARKAGACYAVIEVSSHALHQRRCDGLTFAAGVFTNISGDHLDYHGTLDEYAAAKQHLFDLLEPEGVAVINIDDPVGADFARKRPGRVVTYGLNSSGADVRASIKNVTLEGTEIALHGLSNEDDLRLQLTGRHNVYNALAAAATAESLGIPFESILNGLAHTSGVPGRLQRVEPSSCPFAVFVDYAHTDAALANVLSTLRPLTKGRLLCVFGCGGDRDKSKRPRMAAAAAQFSDVVFVTSDNPRHEEPTAIIEDIVTGLDGRERCRVELEPDRRAAIGMALERARSGDTVLIAGKGHEDYQLVGDAVLAFDDAEVARSFLASRCAKEAVA